MVDEVGIKIYSKILYVPDRPHKSLNPKINFDDSNTVYDLFVKNGGDINCKRFVIYQGAFMQERCLDQLIEGFKMVVCNDVGLILLGGNNKSQYYKHLVKLSSDDKRIVILSYI